MATDVTLNDATLEQLLARLREMRDTESDARLKNDLTVLCAGFGSLLERRIAVEAFADGIEVTGRSPRVLPALNPRIESGPVRFGDDWPGVFLRGKTAGWYALLLRDFLIRPAETDLLARFGLEEIQAMLITPIDGPTQAMLDGPVEGAGKTGNGKDAPR